MEQNGVYVKQLKKLMTKMEIYMILVNICTKHNFEMQFTNLNILLRILPFNEVIGVK